MDDLGKRIDVFCESLPKLEYVFRRRMLFQQLWSPDHADGNQERHCDAGAGACFRYFIFRVFPESSELLDRTVA